MLYEVAGCATAAIVAAFLLAAHFSARLAALEARRLESDLEGLRRAASEKDLTALVTGANSGIGFTLAKLLAQAGVRVFLGCRSAERGNAALARIRATTPAAKCELLLLDVSDPISVFGALRSGRLDVIDYVFLNAGIMPIAHYRWGAAIAATFLGRLRAFLEVGRATPMGAHFLAGPPDAPLAHACGAPSVFASNALGHAILLRQLAPRLREAAERRGTGRAVWTGSIAALPGPSAGGHFHWPRFEVPASGERGEAGGGGGCCAGESYGETKAAVDMLNAALVRACPGLSAAVVCPGFVDTDMTPSLLAALLPALRRLRCVLPGFNVTPERGAHALLAAALAPPGALRGDRKYVLRAGALEAGGAHVPCGEQWPASDQERMLAACGAWEARWREKAGEAAEEPQ